MSAESGVASASQPRAGAWIGVWLSLPLLAVCAIFVIAPLVSVGVSSAGGGGALANYGRFFTSEVSVRTLVFTILLSLLVTAIAVLLGGLLAWVMRTTRHRLVRILCWSAVLVPFWMSVVVKNYAFTLILGRRGVLNSVLEAVFGPGVMIDVMYTNAAVVIGMLYSMLPYAVLPLYVTFLTIDPELARAAQTLGASRTRAISTSILPLALPGIIATASIVFVITVGFYITPVLLGGPRLSFMATLINEQTFTLFNYEGAATSSVILILVAIATLLIAVRAVGLDRIKKALV